MMESPSSLQITAELNNLAPMRDFVQDTAVTLKAAPSEIPKVLLAVNEIVTNIMVHGYQDQEGVIEIEVGAEGDDLVIRIRDQAPPFDPTTVPPPDLTLPLEKRPLGGVGIYLTKQFTDVMSYRLTSTGGNELIMVKKGIIDKREETNK